MKGYISYKISTIKERSIEYSLLKNYIIYIKIIISLISSREPTHHKYTCGGELIEGVYWVGESVDCDLRIKRLGNKGVDLYCTFLYDNLTLG